MFSGINYLLNSSSLNIVQLFLLLNILLTVIYLVYLLLNNKLLMDTAVYTLAVLVKAQLNAILNNIIVLTCLILKSTVFMQCSVLFGHLIFTRAACAIICIVFISFVLVQKVLLFELATKNTALLEYYAVNIWFFIAFLLIWLTGNIYSLLFILDCLSLLVILLVLLGDKTTEETTIFFKLLSLSISVWVGFISTTLILLSGMLFIAVYGSTQNVTIATITLFFISSQTVKLTGAQQLCSAILILAIFFKTGVGVFFAWKRAFFKSFDACGLLAYLAFYFSNIFIYSIYYIMMISLINKILFILLVLLILGSVMFSLLINTSSLDIYSFFAISTLFNTALILCVVIATLTIHDGHVNWYATFISVFRI